MNIDVSQQGERLVFRLNGKIDERGAEDLKSRFMAQGIGTAKEVVFDFKDVPHIGSAGIGKLLLFYKELSVGGSTMRVENASDTICHILKELKLDDIFQVSASGSAE